MNPSIQLKGRVFIRFDIEAVTGLHIGGSDTGIEIGGVDKTVIRDPYSNRPYIPGSSLKGKMRSLVEKRRGLKQNQPIGQGRIHSCGGEYKDKKELDQKGRQEYLACDVCQVFGVPGERPFSTPTRLVVRDVHLSKEWADKLNASGRTDLPYTEIKTEVSIDRVTSAANPRQMERVPAGVVFGGQDDHGKPQPAELVYSIYDGGDCSTSKDVTRLRTVFEGLQLLEDDYLGGLGSRGSGKVRLHNICIELRDCKEALAESRSIGKPVYADLNEAIRDLTNLDKALQEAFK
jgi:CRISPR-associated protein Csm3